MQFMADFKLCMHLCMLFDSIELFIESKVEAQNTKVGKFYVGMRFIHGRCLAPKHSSVQALLFVELILYLLLVSLLVCLMHH